MPDVSTGITAGVGLLGASGSKSSAKRASKAEAALLHQQAESLREQRARDAEQWATYKEHQLPLMIKQWEASDRLLPDIERARKLHLTAQVEDREFYDQTFRPLAPELVDRYRSIANEGYNDDYVAGRAASEYDKQHDVARASNQRQLSRAGVRVDSGLYRGMNDNLELAGQRAAHINEARDTERRYTDSRTDQALEALRVMYGSADPQRTVAGASLNQPSIGNLTNPNYSGAVAGAGAAANRAQENYRQNLDGWTNFGAKVGNWAQGKWDNYGSGQSTMVEMPEWGHGMWT